MCPECGSDNIYYDIGAQHLTAERLNHLVIRPGFLDQRAALDVYVCGECGAVRTFVSTVDALEIIRAKWSRLNE